MHDKLCEAGLYPAVKTFLTGLGYEVKGEVGGCDIVGVKYEGPNGAQSTELVVIAELKLGFTLDLVLQGVQRSAYANSLWLAIKATQRGRDHDKRVRKLCKLLGFGLLAIHVSQGRVEILAEPQPYRPRPNLDKRHAILSEHRSAEVILHRAARGVFPSSRHIGKKRSPARKRCGSPLAVRVTSANSARGRPRSCNETFTDGSSASNEAYMG